MAIHLTSVPSQKSIGHPLRKPQGEAAAHPILQRLRQIALEFEDWVAFSELEALSNGRPELGKDLDALRGKRTEIADHARQLASELEARSSGKNVSSLFTSRLHRTTVMVEAQVKAYFEREGEIWTKIFWLDLGCSG